MCTSLEELGVFRVLALYGWALCGWKFGTQQYTASLHRIGAGRKANDLDATAPEKTPYTHGRISNDVRPMNSWHD